MCNWPRVTCDFSHNPLPLIVITNKAYYVYSIHSYLKLSEHIAFQKLLWFEINKIPRVMNYYT